MPTKTTEDKVLWVPQRILVADLKEGNRIVVKTAHIRMNELSDEKREEVLMYFYTTGEALQVVKSTKVQTIDEPRGRFHARTHIHVNGQACYDKRQHVWIAVPLSA